LRVSRIKNNKGAQMKGCSWSFLTALIGFLLVITGCQPEQSAETAKPDGPWVDDRRILNADLEPENWLAHGRTWSEQRFSPLDQINASTINELALAWYLDLDTNRGQEATPIVVDGVLYSTSAWSKVQAVDARTGQLLWQYDPEVGGIWDSLACCGVQNRGAAIWKGNVYAATLDGRLLSLDAKTGELNWQVNTTDQEQAYTITGAPRVFKDKLVIGNGGAEYGVRGYVSAYDTDTGEMLWRFYTVPGNPAEGFEDETQAMAAETWTGEWWKYGGGGTAWDSFAYDPELNLVYIGTGNGSPWPRSIRSPDGGDNLFLASIVAVNADTGKYVWHYQTVPGDTWDYTAVQHMVLADLQIDGRTQKVIMQAPKNGFYYVIDRANGELISAKNIVPTNWATHIDPETGRPVETLDARYDETLAAKVITPGAAGAHNWEPMSYSPDTGLVYIPAKQSPMPYKLDENFQMKPQPGWNVAINNWDPIEEAIPLDPDFGDFYQGFLLAWDPVTQEEVWRAPHATMQNGGVLTTAGNLVFQGTADEELIAFDATNGEQLWSAATQTGILAPPITYSVDGEQYIAVVAGWGAVSANINGITLNMDGSRRNISRIFAYKIGGSAILPPVPELPVSTVRVEPFGSPEQVGAGGVLYTQHCQMCHGFAVISGGVLTDLRYSAMTTTREAFESVVIQGIYLDSGMASFSPVLSIEEAEAIRAYIADVANQ